MTVLSILVPCLESRRRHHGPLLEYLEKQIRSVYGDAEVVALVDDGKISSGTKRNMLVDRAVGQYRAFVDDDDWVAPDYVIKLLKACLGGPDVVSFGVQFSHLEEKRREYWQLGPWLNDRPSGKMALNHLCAWRRDLADRVRWCDSLGQSDDQLWAQPLIHSLDKIEAKVLPDILYQYRYSLAETTNQSKKRVIEAAAYFGPGLTCFKDDAGEILIEDSKFCVRDRHNRLLPIRPEMKPYHVVHPNE